VGDSYTNWSNCYCDEMLNKKLLLGSIGIGTCISNSIVLFATFLYALFNGGYTTVLINSYNEAVIELFALPISISLGIFALVEYMKGGIKK